MPYRSKSVRPQPSTIPVTSHGSVSNVPHPITEDTALKGETTAELARRPISRKGGFDGRQHLGSPSLPVHPWEHRLADDVRPFSEVTKEPLHLRDGVGPSGDDYSEWGS